MIYTLFQSVIFPPQFSPSVLTLCTQLPALLVAVTDVSTSSRSNSNKICNHYQIYYQLCGI